MLPKDERERAGIKAADKLALVLLSRGERRCRVSLIKDLRLPARLVASLQVRARRSPAP